MSIRHFVIIINKNRCVICVFVFDRQFCQQIMLTVVVFVIFVGPRTVPKWLLLAPTED